MKNYSRIFLIVLDSLGIGAMPDAGKYGDAGANTLLHILLKNPDIQIPHLKKLGLLNLLGAKEPSLGCFLRLKEKSAGKDTMTGHWEMMGLEVKEPFLTFTEHGFPKELIEKLEAAFGRKIVGNKAASGTEIIEEYGEDEIQNGHIIVYTSADSVLQICGHETHTGLSTLYRFCEIAREITMNPAWKVGRVIARPYLGEKKGEFVRTSNRHDYAIKPYGITVLNALKDAGLDVISVGKINDIFSGEGITKAYKSKSSVHGMEQTLSLSRQDFHGLCFVNLVDFDALWGHRRNPEGYARELEKFDQNLGLLLENLRMDDLLLITADHGNDPTYSGTDHTRETVPLLAFSRSMKKNGPLPEQDTFAVIGATIAENFSVPLPEGLIGTSLLSLFR
jgi:phosphopentomutase